MSEPVEPVAPITVLSEDESWKLLSSVALGRLAINNFTKRLFPGLLPGMALGWFGTSVGDHPEIFPVNFVVQRRTVLFRTAEGTKLFSTAVSNRVTFEADGYNLTEGWSVIVKGRAHLLRTSADIKEADSAQLQPWTATRKRHYVRVIPSEITGRRFVFGLEPAEPESYPTSVEQYF